VNSILGKIYELLVGNKWIVYTIMTVRTHKRSSSDVEHDTDDTVDKESKHRAGGSQTRLQGELVELINSSQVYDSP
jgi:hypothetical protein